MANQLLANRVGECKAATGDLRARMLYSIAEPTDAAGE
jgi:hypothetical protein